MLGHGPAVTAFRAPWSVGFAVTDETAGGVEVSQAPPVAAGTFADAVGVLLCRGTHLEQGFELRR